MRVERDSYFKAVEILNDHPHHQRHQDALDRCVARLRQTMPVMGVRNPKIGLPDLTWSYCDPYDWVVGFHAGQLWLALQLTGDPCFRNAARSRRYGFRAILDNRDARHHDLGFQFSLSCVAEWLMTGDQEARDLALRAAGYLLERYRPEAHYIQAWNARSAEGVIRSEFVNGRVIVDTMQNLALLHWAHRETGRHDFAEAANGHATTTLKHLVRPDDTSYHTFMFDPSSGRPLRGETHQGYAHDSCWSRGQSWLIHGYAQCALSTGNPDFIDAARRLATKAEALMGDDDVPVWDYGVPDAKTAPRDSSAGAVMAAGVFILAGLCGPEEAARWRVFGDRLIGGLLDSCDLTSVPRAQGLIAHGAAHVSVGYSDTMLPYGDYYFMEALMRSLGHTRFFW